MQEAWLTSWQTTHFTGRLPDGQSVRFVCSFPADALRSVQRSHDRSGSFQRHRASHRTGCLRQRARHDYGLVGRSAPGHECHHHQQGSTHGGHGRDRLRRCLHARSGCCRARTKSRRSCRGSSRPSSRTWSSASTRRRTLDFSLALGRTDRDGRGRGRESRCSRPTAPTWRRRSSRSSSPTCRCSTATSPSSSCSRPGTQQLQWQHAASENPQGSTQTHGQRAALQRHRLSARRHREPRSDPRHHRHQPDARVDRRDEDHLAELRRRVRPGDRRRRLGADQVGRATTFHGSVFEFYQSDRFQARNPFTQAQPNALTGKFLPDTKKNQFGGSLGGPIIAEQDVLLRRLPGHAQHARAARGC